MRTVQPKILEISEAKLNGKKTSGKKLSKIWVYLLRLPFFFEILENAVPFAIESCQKFKLEVFLFECNWSLPYYSPSQPFLGSSHHATCLWGGGLRDVTTILVTKKVFNTNNDKNMNFWKLHGKINLFLINYKLTNFVRS